MSKTLMVCLLCVILAPAGFAGLTLVKDGQPQAVIVTAAGYGARPAVGSVRGQPRRKVSPAAGRTGTRTSTSL